MYEDCTIGNDSDDHEDHDPDHDSSQIPQENDEDQTQHHSNQQTTAETNRLTLIHSRKKVAKPLHLSSTSNYLL